LAYTFPLLLTDFFEGLPITTSAPDLGEAMEYSETGGGEVMTADIGERLWRMTVTLRPGHYAEIEPIRAKLRMLRQAGRSLLVHSMPLTAPINDPDGVTLGASAVTLEAVASNNRELTLTGLPSGYQLKCGDFLSFTYGSAPVRYAFHQIISATPATVEGLATVEVISWIQPGFTLDAPVKLIKATFKAIIVPQSTNTGSSGQMFTQGVSFDVMQTLR
jgi:hypothetical protein